MSAVAEASAEHSLHSLPSEWTWARLGDICDAINGRAFKSSEWRQAGLPIIRIQNLKDPDAEFNYFAGDLDDRHRVHHGDLLFAWSGTPGTSFGAHIWKGPEAALNQHIFNIKFDPDVLDPRYFCLALNQNVSRYVAQAQGGVGLAHITKSKFLDSFIPLAPKVKQLDLVAEIEKQFSRLDDAVANLKRAKASLKRYRSAVLKAAVEGQLVPTEAEVARREGRAYETGACLLESVLTDRRAQWRGVGKYKEPAAPSSLKQTELPEGWALASVEQLNPAHRPCAYGVLQPGPDSDSGVPFVRVGDIAEGRVAADSLKRINPSIAARYPRTRLEGGELLVTLVGAIGRTAIAPPLLRGSNVARAVAVVPLAQQVDPSWVGAWFRNPRKIAEMNGLAHEVARKTLNLEDVRRSVVALPPLAEQRRIGAEVERLISIVQEVETVVKTTIQRAQTLRHAVLASAFANPAPGGSLNAIEEARS